MKMSSIEDFEYELSKGQQHRGWYIEHNGTLREGKIPVNVEHTVRFGDFFAIRHCHFLIDPKRKSGQRISMETQSSTRWKVEPIADDAFGFIDAGFETKEEAHKKAVSLVVKYFPLWEDSRSREAFALEMLKETPFYLDETVIEEAVHAVRAVGRL